MGVSTGEISPTASPSLLFDSLRGTILNRYLLTATDTVPRFLESKRQYAENLVRFVLEGVNAEAADRS